MKRLTRVFTAAVSIAVAALVLTGCVPSPPSEGVIIDKTYTAAHDETYQVSVSTYDYGCHYANVYNYSTQEYDYDYVCEYYMGDHGETEDRVRHIPDVWTILFEGEDSDEKVVQRTITVSENQYDEARPGYAITVKDDAVFITSR